MNTMATWREDKRRYRQYKARKAELPSSHRETVDAMERYALRTGAVAAQDVVDVLEALVEVFERSAASGTSVDEVVGADPVRFAEDLVGRYRADTWVGREQRRLADAVGRGRA